MYLINFPSFLKQPGTLFFHKVSKEDNIPLRLTNLTINYQKLKREESIEFLEVLLDENLTWKENFKYIENKCAKNIDEHHLNRKCLLGNLCYSYVHIYNPVQNILRKNKKPRQVRQNRKNFRICFCVFLSASTENLFLLEKLGTLLCLHAVLGNFLIFPLFPRF